MRPTTRAAVDARDAGRCVRCGHHLYGRPFSRHHRKPRGMGGANKADANRLSNIVTLCGTATTPGSCHLWAEANRAAARESGWLVPSWFDPAERPVILADGSELWLSDEGSIAYG